MSQEKEQLAEQNELIQKFLQEYHQMKKVNGTLEERLEKAMSEHSVELGKEKVRGWVSHTQDYSARLVQENKKCAKAAKDARLEVQNLEAQLMARDNEIKDLRRRLELKSLMDDRTKERDSNVFVKFLGRKPCSTNSQDQKLVSILNHYENARERHDKEVAHLQLELKKALENHAKMETHSKQQEINDYNNKLQIQKNHEQMLLAYQDMKKDVTTPRPTLLDAAGHRLRRAVQDRKCPTLPPGPPPG